MSQVKYRVLHPYKSNKTEELILNVGDLVKITHDANKGMCYGQIVDTTSKGLFPRSFVERVEENDIITHPLSQQLKHGILTKKRKRVKTWKKNYVCLYPRSIAWFKNSKTIKLSKIVHLKDMRLVLKIMNPKTKKPTFVIQSNIKTWEFRCNSEKERNNWFQTIKQQISNITNECTFAESKSLKKYFSISNDNSEKIEQKKLTKFTFKRSKSEGRMNNEPIFESKIGSENSETLVQSDEICETDNKIQNLSKSQSCLFHSNNQKKLIK
ncbi:dual adapter for phosphotyrosine and 3-phosphotyrosine and 3-phosphoinositide [Anaeramoeba flamelloides]|uniref:Dual adapter for phosphotyrosine and 3-phosphotyrosine and 3-phosphoinositide n=1 Tax=Anaeramoeba flamelloides TaxID=1746091 RepID=A0AAV7YR06_9EUKA|nr:dual adapter for phosphotyrosine and 3-phosphotyrosine and 3-phosphoinositide [Anaeramoeba flamelloides]